MISISKILQKIKLLWFSICCTIYDLVITYPLTKSIYVQYSKILEKTFKGEKFSMIDIGTGTGSPLQAFMKESSANRVLAIDINPAYVKKAKSLFKNDERVDVQLVNWLEYAEGEVKEKFDVVFFGFSFMLMPNKKRVNFK